MIKLHTSGVRVVLLLQALLALNLTSQAQNNAPNAGRLNLPGLARANRPAASNRFTMAQAGVQKEVSTKLPKFVAHRDYVAADVPTSLAAGDLNGDGIMDVVVPNDNSTAVSVLLGNRDGSFQAFRLFNTQAAFPFDAAIADFNGDGKNDVAVTTSTGVSVMPGDGNGNLGAPLILTAGQAPARLVALDLNGDHKIDLAVTNLVSNDISIFLGRGNGQFASAVSIPVGMAPSGIAAGDFNHDGRPDLVVADSGVELGNNQGAHANTVAFLLSDGKGGLLPPTFVKVEKTPLNVVVDDLNQDGKQDLVVSNNLPGDLSELLGNGDGTFQAPRIFHVGVRADAIGIADLNGDGKKDLLASNGPLTSVSLLLGDGAGGFQQPRRVASGRFPVAILTGDFNHDGKVDFVTANADPNTISVVLGRGDGTFFDIKPGASLASDLVNQTISADFNGDGLPDLALADTGLNQDGHTVEVLFGKSNGFSQSKIFEADLQPEGLAATDFNRDGHLDLVVANFGHFPDNSGSVSLLLGDGNGFQKAGNFPAGDFPVGIATADFNGDSNADAIVSDFGTNVGVAGISLLLGNGKDGFAKPKSILVLPAFNQISEIVSGDFNRDGKADIAYLTSSDQVELSVQFGNGDGSFQPAVIVTSASAFQEIFFTFSVGDFNGDGIADFAVEESGQVEVVLGDGQGHFHSAGKFLDGSAAGFSFIPSLLLADFNGDGTLDVAAVDGFGAAVNFLPGNGDGTLGPATLFAGGFADSAAAVSVGHSQPSIVLPSQSRLVGVQNATPSN